MKPKSIRNKVNLTVIHLAFVEKLLLCRIYKRFHESKGVPFVAKNEQMGP